uniref:ORF1 protein n=1 Tax=Psittacine aviadenovirus B TaxID=2169709 RepID=A0AB38ZP89_9ADEN
MRQLLRQEQETRHCSRIPLFPKRSHAKSRLDRRSEALILREGVRKTTCPGPKREGTPMDYFPRTGARNYALFTSFDTERWGRSIL